MPKKEKKPLNPQIEQSGDIVDQEKLEAFTKAVQDSETIEGGGGDASTFFRSILKQFFSTKNIGMKTEYLNVYENYIGAKLDFLSAEIDMPYMNRFIKMFEIKRVSLERKGRKELLMSIQERNKEIEEQKMSQLKSFFGMS
jgi:hypothetical protein